MADGVLLGRDAELVVVDAFLDRLVCGPGALVFEGDPGVGKTTLWRELLRRAEGRSVRVLSACPVEAESRLSYLALGDLLDAVPGEIFDELPGPQRRALEVALLQSDPGGEAPDPGAVAAAFRTVVARVASELPVLLAIDDVQWLDSSSAQAVGFAVRREPVTVAATRRVGTSMPSSLEAVLSGATRIAVGPLSLAATHELLNQRLGRSLPRPLLVRVHETAQGNPFYALEVAREVLEEGVSAGDPLPVPADLRRLLTTRIGRLSPAAQELLLVTASVGYPTRELIAAALDAEPAAVIEEAELAGLVEQLDGQVRFTHPLYAAAVYAAAPRERRRRLHRGLAGLVEGEEARARHLALATDSPSEEVAAVLERAGGLAAARAAPAAAAELLELATALTPASKVAELRRRRLAAVDGHLAAGAVADAVRLLERLLEESTPGNERAEVLLRLGEASDDRNAALALFEQARSEQVTDERLLSRVHVRLGEVWPQRGVGYALDHGEIALQHAERSGDRRLAVQVMARLSLWELWAGRDPSSVVTRAVALERAADRLHGYGNPRLPLALWRMYQGRLDEARTLFEALLAESVGDELNALAIRCRLVDVAIRAGELREAAAGADAAVELMEQIGIDTEASYFQALAQAYLGNETVARATAELGAESSRAKGHDNALVMELGVLGFLELSLGRDSAALPHLQPLLDWLKSMGLCLATHPMAPYALEALVAANRIDEARVAVDQFAREAKVQDSPWALAIAARCRGLLAAAEGDLHAGQAELEDSLAFDAQGRWPFEKARTLLLLGRVQRRVKQKAAAKQSLGQAQAIFERLSAGLWVERAQDELKRIGLRPPARDELTETERRVAELAAAGLKNREVAAQLFLSPKTVEANLARVYRKLGIHSRAELGARLAP